MTNGPQASIAVEGGTFRFTEDVSYKGWEFPAGTVVTLTSTFVPYLDWYEMLVTMPDGEGRRIGAGIIDLHTVRVDTPVADNSTSAPASAPASTPANTPATTPDAVSISTPPCPSCGHALTAAYDDGEGFWECDGCGREVEDRDLR